MCAFLYSQSDEGVNVAAVVLGRELKSTCDCNIIKVVWLLGGWFSIKFSFILSVRRRRRRR